MNCVFIVPSSNLFPKSLTNEFRHDPASASRHARRRVLPLLLCRSTLASPPRILFCLARFPFLFFGMVVAGEVGVLLRGEMKEFKRGIRVFPQFFLGFG